jgi:hypothetical protein
MDYNLSTTGTVVLMIWAIWELSWKGMALWKAGRDNQRGWFIALLLINSVGILPIIYLSMYRKEPDFEKESRHEKTIPIKG